MHPDDVMLLRFRHGEADAVSAARVREHLAACNDCRGRLETTEREDVEIESLLRSIDTTPPRVDLRTVVATARARRRPVHRRAAVIAFLLAGGAVAWALPGSPLKRWLTSASASIQAPGPGAASTEPVERSGITVPPGDQLSIVFSSEQPAGSVAVLLVDDAEAAVSAPVGVATFTSNGQRLEIGNRSTDALYEIRIPRDAPRVDVRVADREIWRKMGDEVTAGIEPDAGGRWVIPLALPRR